MSERLTPENFKQLVHAKGWTFRALAQRWHVTPEWVSEVSRNPARSPHYDDAVNGLPELRLKHEAGSSSRLSRKGSTSTRTHRPRPKRIPPGYRYQGIINVGELLCAAGDVGSMAEMGDRGIVVQVIDTGLEESYRVLFQRGDVECFSADLVDQYLATIGLSDEASLGYVYRSDAELKIDFQSGKFDFREG